MSNKVLITSTVTSIINLKENNNFLCSDSIKKHIENLYMTSMYNIEKQNNNYDLLLKGCIIKSKLFKTYKIVNSLYENIQAIILPTNIPNDIIFKKYFGSNKSPLNINGILIDDNMLEFIENDQNIIFPFEVIERNKKTILDNRIKKEIKYDGINIINGEITKINTILKTRPNLQEFTLITNNHSVIIEQPKTYTNTITYRGVEITPKINLINNINTDSVVRIEVTGRNNFNDDMNIYPPLQLLIERSKPPIAGPLDKGSNIRNFKYTIQKNSFIEIILNFTNIEVIEVIGLPDKLKFDKKYNKIYGTCELAGKFTIVLKMDTGDLLEGMIVVTNLHRLK